MAFAFRSSPRAVDPIGPFRGVRLTPSVENPSPNPHHSLLRPQHDGEDISHNDHKEQDEEYALHGSHHPPGAGTSCDEFSGSWASGVEDYEF